MLAPKNLWILSILLSLNFTFSQESLNVNYLAKKYLSSGNYVGYTYKVGLGKYQLIVEFLDEKDLAGNQQTRITAIPKSSGNLDTLILVPSFPPYPLTYSAYTTDYIIREELNTSESYRRGRPWSCQEGWEITGGSNCVLKRGETTIRNGMFAGTHTYSADHMDPYISNSDKTVTKGLKFQAENFSNEEHVKNEFHKRWEAAHEWINSLLKTSKEKTYDALMLEAFDHDNFYVFKVYRNQSTPDMDPVRISFTKDAEGNLKTMDFHFPYKDHKFYDKERFKLSIQKDNTGMFLIKDENNLGLPSNRYVIPVDKYAFLAAKSNNSGGYIKNVKTIYSPSDAITPNAYPPQMIHHAIKHDYFFPWTKRNVESSVLSHTEEMYMKWKAKKELWSSYKYSEDLAHIDVFLSNYVKNIFSK